MTIKSDNNRRFGATPGSPESGYRVVRQFTRQGVRKSDMTPEWHDEMKKKFGEIHGPSPIANSESIDWNDIVRKSSLVISILRDEETGIEEVTETYSYDVDT